MLSGEAIGFIMQLSFLIGFSLSLGVLVPVFIYKKVIRREENKNVFKEVRKK